MPEMKPVQSSNIRSIGYDPESREMHVEFTGGTGGVYEDVPPEEHSNFMDRPIFGSHGQHHSRFIKDRFKWRKNVSSSA